MFQLINILAIKQKKRLQTFEMKANDGDFHVNFVKRTGMSLEHLATFKVDTFQ